MARRLVLPLTLAVAVITVWIATRDEIGTDPVRAQASYELDPTRKIDGRVIFPERTPPDERVVVVLEGLPAFEDDDVDAQLRMLFGEWDEVARVEVEAGGRFTLPMPTGVEALRIALDANYLVLERQVEIEGLDDPGTVELEPRLGGRVTFVLRPPLDTAFDPEVLAGRTVWMSHLPKAGIFVGQAPQVSFQVGADLTFEGRALPVDRDYSVNRSSFHAGEQRGLAPFVVDGDWDLALTAGEHLRVDIPLLDG